CQTPEVNGTAPPRDRPPAVHPAGTPIATMCLPAHRQRERQTLRPSSSRRASTRPPEFEGWLHSGQDGAHAAHLSGAASSSRSNSGRSEEHTSELQSRENLVCR